MSSPGRSLERYIIVAPMGPGKLRILGVRPGNQHQSDEQLDGSGDQQELRVVDLRQSDVRKEVEVVIGQEREPHRDVPDLLGEGDDTERDSQRDSKYRHGVRDERGKWLV